MTQGMQLLKLGIKFLGSYIFRVILILNAIYIISNYNNEFTIGFYAAITVLYLVFIVVLILRFSEFAFVRLLLDLLYIFFIIFGKEVNDLILSSFVILPVVNATNHTGKKNPSMFLLCYTLLIYAIHSSETNLSLIVPLVSFLIILFFDYYKQKLRNFNEYLTFVLDDFFNKNVSRVDLKSLLIEFVDKINQTNFKKVFYIESIYVFERFGDRIVLKGGSGLVFDVRMDLDKTRINMLDEEGVVHNLKTIRNREVSANNNFITQIDIDGKKYIFLIDIIKGQFWFLSKHYIHYVFKPRFYALINLAERDLRIRRIHTDLIKNMREKSTYIMNTISAIHFLRNRFSPIKNYLSIIDKEDFFVGDPEKLKSLQEIIKNEAKTANASLKNIIDKVDYILEKRDNPFTVSELTEIKLADVLNLVRGLWVDYLKDDKFYINFSNLDDAHQNLFSNYIGLEIAFTDIISNIAKHSVGNNHFLLEDGGDNVVFIFRNQINTSNKNVNNFSTFISRFMSRDVYEVNSRSTGLSSLKVYLTQMNIDYDLSLDASNIFSFVLRVQKNQTY